jgi:glycosyltransferase involved in cell wall biosynthesis
MACEFYSPSIGGVQEVMRQIGERFVRAGHEVVVATSHLPERRSLKIDGVAVEEFRVSGNLARGMTGEIQRFRDYVMRQDYDILMIKAAQQWTFDALTPVLDAIQARKIFIPCGFSGLLDPVYADYYERMPEWLKAFDRLIFYASDYRDINLAKKHGLKNIAIVPNGADEREFDIGKDARFRARHGIREDAFVVMTVGSLTGLKGHLELAHAFQQCDFGSVPACLILVANRPSAPKRTPWPGWLKRLVGRPLTPEMALKPILERINATEGRQVIFGDFPRPEVVQAYQNSNLFVLASKIEYSPLVLFEAAAAGLPFISVPVGNAAEVAQWTGGGQICAASVDARGYTLVDPGSLARHIQALAERAQTRADLGAAGRRSWEQRFTWDRVYRCYERLFQDCLQEPSA